MKKIVNALVVILGVLVFSMGVCTGAEFAGVDIFSLPSWATGTSAIFQGILTLGFLLVGLSLMGSGYFGEKKIRKPAGALLLALGFLVLALGIGVAAESAGIDIFSLPSWTTSTSAVFQLALALVIILVGSALIGSGYIGIQGKRKKGRW